MATSGKRAKVILMMKLARDSYSKDDVSVSVLCLNYESFVSTVSLRLRVTNFLCTSASGKGVGVEKFATKRLKTLASFSKLLK